MLHLLVQINSSGVIGPLDELLTRVEAGTTRRSRLAFQGSLPSLAHGRRSSAAVRHRSDDAVLRQKGSAKGLHEVLPAPTTQP